MNVIFRAAKYENGNLEEIIEEAGKTHPELYLGVIKSKADNQACLVTLRDNKIVQRPCIVDVIPKWDDGDKSTTLFYFMGEERVENVYTLADQLTRLGRLENSFSFPFANGVAQAIQCDENTYNTIIELKRKHPNSTLEDAFTMEKQAEMIRNLESQLESKTTLQEQFTEFAANQLDQQPHNNMYKKQMGNSVIIESISEKNGVYEIGESIGEEQYICTIKEDEEYYLITLNQKGSPRIKPCVVDERIDFDGKGNPIRVADYYFFGETDETKSKEIARKIERHENIPNVVDFGQLESGVHAFACDTRETFEGIKNAKLANPKGNIATKRSSKSAAPTGGLSSIL